MDLKKLKVVTFLLTFIIICAFLVGVSSTEEQKVIRRRKIISDVEPLVNKKIYSQLLDAQESQPRAREFSELTKRKLRRKQNPVAVFNSPQQSINDLTIDKPKRKKIAVIIPNVLLTSTSTTTPRPASQSIITTDGALNRTEDDPRFLSLFTVIRFKNEACRSGSGSNGTCYSTGDCQAYGGFPSGSCAQGFGVCCLFTKTCSESTNTNGTYFQNKAYPSTFSDVGSCQLTVNKCNENVCQLRLDFQNFLLSQPDTTDNQCRYDQFIVSGGSSPVPAICGTNTGQHLYVDMGLAYNNPITLTVVSSGGAGSTRSFSIRVTQIECASLNKAPESCLQYFTGITGTLMTFNYMDAAGLQLSNTDYTMCVRSERNFCGIQYTACPDLVNVPATTIQNQVTMNYAMSFSVTGGNPSTGTIVGTNCATDWVTIPCATNTMDVNLQTGTPTVCVDRICGMVFNSVTTQAGQPSVPVNSYVKPFTVHVHTNAVEGSSTPAETKNRGFCLKYVQQPCTSTG